MTHEHTPEPWRVECNPDWPFDFKISGPDITVRRVAYSTRQKTIDDVRDAVGFPHENREEMKALIAKQEADVCLIASAPELLGYHKTILAILGNVDHSRGGGRNAAKLYGEMLEDIRKVSEAAVAKATGK